IDRAADGSYFYEVPVWTATHPDGLGFGDGNHCQNWSTNDADLKGRFGLSGFTDVWWTDVDDILVGCAAAAQLYCFEQF
ncbi:MAG TPA: hypothetical protein PKW35_25210, partial [Nannocystaceae bacterium]|nr:hypothetical protein [Nannocystaceae bacterium]